MQRRRFLQSLFSALGLAAVPLARAEASPWVRVQTSPLAGFQHHEGETVWPVLRPGDRLTLAREPHNRYDPQAVRVEWKGFMLGYVPRAENRAVARLLDGGARLEARVADMRESHNPWDRVRMEIMVKAEEA
jgi:HIRAN domain.